MYYGGKNGNGTRQIIINFIPPHHNYIEAFMGSGAILHYKKLAQGLNIGIEIDTDTIGKFKNRFSSEVEIIHSDSLKWLKEFKHHSPDTFIYLDPPYPIESRKEGKKRYKYEFSNKNHIELLKFISTCKSKIAISTYPNPLYKKMLKKWNVESFFSKTQKGMAMELLYMNYKRPTILHDFSFVGKNFTERQRIKRRIKNQIRILASLDPLERNAIFTSLRIAGIIE